MRPELTARHHIRIPSSAYARRHRTVFKIYRTFPKFFPFLIAGLFLFSPGAMPLVRAQMDLPPDPSLALGAAREGDEAGQPAQVFVPPEVIDAGPGEVNPFIAPTEVPPILGPSSPAWGTPVVEMPVDGWHLLPEDSLLQSFLMGVHEPRMGGEIINDSDQGTLMDVTIGGRMSLLRYGTVNPRQGSEGVELQVYGAALTRLSMDRQSDVEATDYKFGVPLVFRSGRTAHSIGYDHLSSHIGDEYLVRNRDFERRNYVRDAIRYAVIHDLSEEIAVYAEVNSAFHTSGGAGKWHFQFGAEYQPLIPRGFRGAPVAAINTQLREEFDFEGSLGLLLGWQWQGMSTDDLLRIGLSVYTGRSRQFSFFDQYEKLVGVGLWYDF